MRVLICGSRTWTDREKIRNLIRELPYHAVMIVGDCQSGADALAEIEAKLVDLRVEKYYANWDQYGRAAGPIRNSEMVKEGKPEFCFAFRMPGKSSGTDDCVAKCRRAGVDTYVIGPEDEVKPHQLWVQLALQED